MLRRLAVAFTGLAIAGTGLLGTSSVAYANCPYNIGGTCYGNCTFNTGTCEDDGTCYVNTGTCDDDCYINTGTCRPPAVQIANLSEILDRILHSVEG